MRFVLSTAFPHYITDFGNIQLRRENSLRAHHYIDKADAGLRFCGNFCGDKKAVYDDVRLEQINEFSYVAPEVVFDATDLAMSEMLRREVYKKESGLKLMAQKLVVWKTNKPAPEYPAYVFHYTNFSSERKDSLQREVMVSDDESQIMRLCDASIAENIKKGWNAVT